MTPVERAALERAVSKMMNSRYRPDAYADLCREEDSLENVVGGLKNRYAWSRYQSEEVLRLARIYLEPTE